MNSYYEKHREDSEEILVRRNEAPKYPVHFHANLEIFIIGDGSGSILLDGKRQKLGPWTVAIADGYTAHGYDTDGQGDTCILAVPFSLLGGFYGGKHLAVENPVFCDKPLVKRLLCIVDEYLVGGNSEEIKKKAVELLLACLKEKLTFTQKKDGADGALIRAVLSYIHENYTAELSRKSIAKALGYAEGYISRVFHKFLGVGILEYINKLRLKRIERLQSSGDKRKTIELIYEAGFSSQQTYYRVKSKFGEKNQSVGVKTAKDL